MLNEAQTIATSQLDQILSLIGPHGIFSILGTFAFVRMITGITYFSRLGLILVSVPLSLFFGGFTVYFAFPDPSIKEILGGCFMTLVGSPLFYEGSKGLLKALISWKNGTELGEFFIGLYWFFSPKAIDIKKKTANKNKINITIPPHAGLTEATQWARIDKQIAKQVEEYDSDDSDDITKFIPENDRAGPKYRGK